MFNNPVRVNPSQSLTLGIFTHVPYENLAKLILRTFWILQILTVTCSSSDEIDFEIFEIELHLRHIDQARVYSLKGGSDVQVWADEKSVAVASETQKGLSFSAFLLGTSKRFPYTCKWSTGRTPCSPIRLNRGGLEIFAASQVITAKIYSRPQVPVPVKNGRQDGLHICGLSPLRLRGSNQHRSATPQDRHWAESN